MFSAFTSFEFEQLSFVKTFVEYFYFCLYDLMKKKIHTLSNVHFDRLFFSSSFRNLVVLFMKKEECFGNSLLQNSHSFDKTVSGC